VLLKALVLKDDVANSRVFFRDGKSEKKAV
jgi:hypothetical protein